MQINLKYKSSTFFSNFSVNKLVRKNNSRSGVICSLGGGGGGGVGFGSEGQANKSEEAHFTAHDSYSYHINFDRRLEFDESEIVYSFKEGIEEEIARSGAEVTKSEELNSSEFYIEYNDEGIQGNIKVKGNFDGENFKLEAILNERSKSEKKPLIEKREDVYQPIGNFHVIAFPLDDTNARMFYEKGRKAAEESRERLRQKYLADKAKGNSITENMEYAVMYVWVPMLPQIRQRFQEMMGEDFVSFTEYDQYGRVYFLNELALRMYRDIGEDFEVLKVIKAEDVAKIPGEPSFRVYYIPKEK